MAARQIKQRKAQLVVESEALRNGLRDELAALEPTISLVEKGYTAARTGSFLWKCIEPLREKNSGWAWPKTILRFLGRDLD